MLLLQLYIWSHFVLCDVPLFKDDVAHQAMSLKHSHCDITFSVKDVVSDPDLKTLIINCVIVTLLNLMLILSLHNISLYSNNAALLDYFSA